MLRSALSIALPVAASVIFVLAVIAYHGASGPDLFLPRGWLGIVPRAKQDSATPRATAAVPRERPAGLTVEGEHAKKRPNFVYFLLDDMGKLLGDEHMLPKTRKLLVEAGAEFDNFFVSSPKCTPSRSAWLTGRYYHNIRPNGATYGRGLNTTNHFDPDSVFPRLHNSGYKTASFGKIHNDQAIWLCNKQNHTEPFSHIVAPCAPCGKYYTQQLVIKEDDASIPRMETHQEQMYTDAEYGNRSMAWIEKVVKTGSPFFLYIGTVGPHLPVIPAPWHRETTEHMNISAPRTPNFNQAAPDHHPLLATAPEVEADALPYVDRHMRDRWGVLLHIDDLIAGVVGKLEEQGVLDNTYVMFSSDNGYHLGQFRIPDEKMMPYETDIRVPFYIRGPGIRPGTRIPQLAANVDIAPTLVDLAGLAVPPIMDGKSMAPLLHGLQPKSWRTSFITEFAEGGVQKWGTNIMWKLKYDASGVAGDMLLKPPMSTKDGRDYVYDTPDYQWRQLRVLNATHDISFTEWDPMYVFDTVDFCEFYDIKSDPWQQQNLCPKLTARERQRWHQELVVFYECRGTRTRPSNCP